MAHIIFVSELDEKVASYRFRVAKLLPGLRLLGHEMSLVRFDTAKVLWSSVRIIVSILGGYRSEIVVVFQKSYHPLLSAICRIAGAKVVLDVDDAPNSRIDGTKPSARAQNRKVRAIKSVDWVVCGSRELAFWVEKFSSRCSVIPTCLDTQIYAEIGTRSKRVVVVGWIGSGSVDAYFDSALPAILKLAEEGLCQVMIVGDIAPEVLKAKNIDFICWRSEMEPDVFREFDIGIMPLPNNDRARMKAGFKLLQYMASSLPVVASPVGINKEIVEESEAGYLATTTEEWYASTKRLILDAQLRAGLGAKGKAYVFSKYDTKRSVGEWDALIKAMI